MTKNINGDVYSDLITSADSRAMASGSIPRKTIDRIVIHHNATTNKNVAINTWLANGSAQTSAHYEIADNEIIGIVGEGTTAWHAGNGDMNARSIGIENVNNSGAPNWTISDATFDSLSRLVADIAKRYGFPIDSNHVIPHKSVVSTACPGGIDVSKVIKRANEIAGNKTVTPVSKRKPAPNQPVSSAIQSFKNAGGVFTAYKTFRVDKIAQVNGIWQMINVGLAGGNDFNWTYNGIPLDIVDNVTRGNQLPTQVGDMVLFNKSYNHGTIDDYDNASNAVGIKYGDYGEIWFNADAFIKL